MKTQNTIFTLLAGIKHIVYTKITFEIAAWVLVGLASKTSLFERVGPETVPSRTSAVTAYIFAFSPLLVLYFFVKEALQQL